MGLGSGPHVHGRASFITTCSDYPKFKPRMAKVFGNAGEVILKGLKQYVHDVTTHVFPA